MSDIQEVKDSIKTHFDASQKVLDALRKDIDAVKSRDVVDQDRVAKMETDLAAQLKAAQDATQALEAKFADVETKLNRPGGPGAGDDTEVKAFSAYAKSGKVEEKAMTTSSNADGGYVVPATMEAGIRDRLHRSSPVRAVANVVTIDGGTYEILVERGQPGYEWGGEGVTPSDSASPTINKIQITTHDLSALPKISQRLLDEANFDIGGWLEGRIGAKFSQAEATAFVAGTGVNQPKGFAAYSTAATADASRAAETLEHIATGASGAFNSTNPANVFANAFYTLQAQYMANAVWMMKNTTAATVATMQDGAGAYLMQSMLNSAGGLLNTIHGKPVYLADDMPAVAANSLSVAVGDFREGYTIVEGRATSVLRDPFSAKPHVLFYATKRIGGGVSNFDAIKMIKFA